MKSSSSRRNPRNAAIRTPDGLDQVYGVHALESLLERGEAPRELWVQQGAGSRLKDVVANAQVSGARIKEQSREVLDQLTQGAGKVSDLIHRHDFRSTAGDFSDRGIQRCCFVFCDNHAMSPRSIGTTQAGTEVMHIGDAIQHQQ